MARIKIDFPDTSLTKISLPVRITDINYGNHLGNDALVGLLHEARVMWLNQLGWTELNIDGASIIMSDLAVQYLTEAFYGQQLEIELFSGDITAAGFELYYKVTVNSNNGIINIAKAKTGIVFFDYSSRKVRNMPESFKELLLNGR
jgi:acyl-CoA thioester hydrolase